VLLPAGVAALLLPARGVVPAVDVALVLVGVIAIAGTVGIRITPVLTGLSGALAFDLLWTEPYGSPLIREPADRFSGIVVLLVGAGLAERARRGGRDRARIIRLVRPRSLRSAHLLTIGRVASDIAEGDAAGLVVLDIARGLVELLALRDCRFEIAPLSPGARPVLLHSGELELRGTRWSPTAVALSSDGFDLPVVARGRVVGRFVCEPRRRTTVTREQIGVALTLADQAASALLLTEVA
jgi:hypothetical protein